jgi:hypothetical protein
VGALALASWLHKERADGSLRWGEESAREELADSPGCWINRSKNTDLLDAHARSGEEQREQAPRHAVVEVIDEPGELLQRALFGEGLWLTSCEPMDVNFLGATSQLDAAHPLPSGNDARRFLQRHLVQVQDKSEAYLEVRGHVGSGATHGKRVKEPARALFVDRLGGHRAAWQPSFGGSRGVR